MEFRIGSFAQLVNNGERCEIVSALVPLIVWDKALMRERMVMAYQVLLSDGRHDIAEPGSLRRIGRECDRVVPWSACMWKPIPGMVARLERELGYAQQRRISYNGGAL
jgi:hypothetical protein